MLRSRRLISTIGRNIDMSPFPIALCGKNPTLASQFVKMMDEGGEFQGNNFAYRLLRSTR